MPLPGKKPPVANPNAAQQPPAAASKGKSRLPALPQGGLKPKNSIQFLEIPKTMDRCYYVLRIKQIKEGVSAKTNLSRVEAEFEVLETDVSGVKTGSNVFEYLDMQGERSLYFWQNFAALVLAASGKDSSDAAAFAEFEADAEANLWEVVNENVQPLAGSIVVKKFRRGPKKDGSGMTFYSDWEPAGEEISAKYSSAE